jgi:hypothetical protein
MKVVQFIQSLQAATLCILGVAVICLGIVNVNFRKRIEKLENRLLEKQEILGRIR